MEIKFSCRFLSWSSGVWLGMHSSQRYIFRVVRLLLTINSCAWFSLSLTSSGWETSSLGKFCFVVQKYHTSMGGWSRFFLRMGYNFLIRNCRTDQWGKQILIVNRKRAFSGGRGSTYLPLLSVDLHICSWQAHGWIELLVFHLHLFHLTK